MKFCLGHSHLGCGLLWPYYQILWRASREVCCFERWERMDLSIGLVFFETHIFIKVNNLLNPAFDYFQVIASGHCGFCPCQLEGLPDIWGPEMFAWAPSRVGISFNGITALLLPSCPCILLWVEVKRRSSPRWCAAHWANSCSGNSANMWELSHI